MFVYVYTRVLCVLYVCFCVSVNVCLMCMAYCVCERL